MTAPTVTAPTAPTFTVGDRVTFLEREGATPTPGAITRPNWSRGGQYVSILTEDGRTFVRLATRVTRD